MSSRSALRRVSGMTLVIFAASCATAQAQTAYRIPAGTRLRLSLDVELSSKVASVNDTFLATVTEPVSVDQMVVLPAGSVVEGRVTDVSPAASFGQNGRLQVRFESVRAFERVRPIEGDLVPEIRPRDRLFLLGYFIRGQEARLRKGEQFEVELKKDVVLPPIAY